MGIKHVLLSQHPDREVTNEELLEEGSEPQGTQYEYTKEEKAEGEGKI